MTDASGGTRYVRANNAAEALSRLAQGREVLPLGGGTDLLPALHDHLVHADELVDVRGIDEWSGVTVAAAGAVRIGAATTLDALARHPELVRTHPALARACALVGSPALRVMGTLGGNLCQRPRCTYFRHAFPCYKHGGTTCFAVDGPNEHHAILGAGPCHIVHPSDVAVSLLAMDAIAHLASTAGQRAVQLADFFVLPAARLDGETCLRAGEVVTALELPASTSGGRQRFDKVMQRGAWDFAVVSLAAARRRDGGVRLVLGGVAPIPWRVSSSVEEDVASGGLSTEDIETLAARALYDAQPLSGNGYKVDLATNLLCRAMEWLSGSSD